MLREGLIAEPQLAASQMIVFLKGRAPATEFNWDNIKLALLWWIKEVFE